MRDIKYPIKKKLIMSAKSSAYRVPPPPDIQGSEDAWFVSPKHTTFYDWYVQASETLQSARATLAQTKLQCPNCNAARSVTNVPLHVACSVCGWEIDLRPYRAFEPKAQLRQLETRAAGLRGNIVQIKNEMTYQEVDRKVAYDTMRSQLDETNARIESIKPFMKHDYLVALASS
jgi:hypothetical protein